MSPFSNLEALSLSLSFWTPLSSSVQLLLDFFFVLYSMLCCIQAMYPRSMYLTEMYPRLAQKENQVLLLLAWLSHRLEKNTQPLLFPAKTFFLRFFFS